MTCPELQADLLDACGDDLIGDWERQSRTSVPVSVSSTFPRPVGVLDLPDDEPVEFLVDRLIYRGDINYVVGDGGAMKSTFTLVAGCSIATGKPLFGEFVTTAGPVLYVSEEDPRGRIRMRGYAIARGHQMDYGSVNDLYVLARNGALLEDSGWQRHIRSVAQELGCVAIAFDPLRKLTRLDLNSDKDVAAITGFLSSLNELPSRPGVIVNHHSGKKREGQRTLDRVSRGSAAIDQSSRSMLYIEKRQGGFEVDQLKVQDSPRSERFVVEMQITTGEHEWQWETARFTYSDRQQANTAAGASAVIAFIRVNPGEMSERVREGTREANPGLSAVAISSGLSKAHEEGAVRYESGSRNRRFWYVSDE